MASPRFLALLAIGLDLAGDVRCLFGGGRWRTCTGALSRDPGDCQPDGQWRFFL